MVIGYLMVFDYMLVFTNNNLRVSQRFDDFSSSASEGFYDLR